MSKTTQIKTLAGYGYMRRQEEKGDVPSDTIRGYYLNANRCTDPVQIGSYVVEQADLTNLRRTTGRLPCHMTTTDYSGSYRYLHSIEWTEEEIIAAKKEPANLALVASPQPGGEMKKGGD